MEKRGYAADELRPLSDDKLAYTFTLRDGLAWNDGTPGPVCSTEYCGSRKVLTTRPFGRSTTRPMPSWARPTCR